jgi:hypothetical protein
MTDAPERIWANPDQRRRKETEYVRDADLVPRWSTDMDAAPKDGTRVLTFHPANPGAIIKRARKDNYVINAMKAGQRWYSLPEQPPVAWMLLPPPPIKGET